MCECEEQVDIGSFRQQQEEALKEVGSALLESIKATKKRASRHEPPVNAKKQKRVMSAFDDLSDDDDSIDSDSDREEIVR